ncbi:16S rRNA (cytosine(967)-C(5))-methyltransferase [hydrothermal vent metagenome]|uniref:16S rRNA (cytosine(967)-C(5))-methyltransferase n=1 Tax=hydrothermal vent metagenome TaxID=652676 RepID=A0A3B1AFK2_9ZZZZ
MKKQQTKKVSAIAATASIITNVVKNKKNLPDCISEYQYKINQEDIPKVQAYCYNILRRYEFYQFIVDALLDKPLKNKDQDIYHLILSGVMLLNEGNLPAHAAINETVNVTKKTKKIWAKNLVNALLRRYQRDQFSLHSAADNNPVSHYCCPEWLLKKIQNTYPDIWQTILKANLQHPPMTLRVNQLMGSRENYLNLLSEENLSAQVCPLTKNGILLEQAVNVEKLPRFSEGAVSVQDSAAQYCAELLNPQADESILDACAAPGGKTLHLFESCPQLAQLIAIDISAKRLEKVQQNITRITPDQQNKFILIAANASDTKHWWNGKQFDRILLDAPCSATGVIRRHPDIKRLRKASDINALLITQQQLLVQLWPTLKKEGLLLYATCSILPEENAQQIKTFLSSHNDAQSVSFDVSWGQPCEYGQQLLPICQSGRNQTDKKNKGNSDGFYYCLLQKK